MYMNSISVEMTVPSVMVCTPSKMCCTSMPIRGMVMARAYVFLVLEEKCFHHAMMVTRLMISVRAGGIMRRKYSGPIW